MKVYRSIKNIVFVMISLVVLCVNLSFDVWADDQRKIPDKIALISINANGQLNDSAGGGAVFPVPIAFYQKKDFLKIPGRTTLITGGIFNSIQWASQDIGKFGVTLGFRSLLFVAGDGVRIDGNRFGEQYDFSGNFYDLFLGADYRDRVFNLPLKFSFGFLNRYQHFFSRTPNINYSYMDHFWQVSPFMRLDYGIFLPDLPIPYQFRTRFLVRKNFRFGDKTWGLNTSPYGKNDPLDLELNIKSKVRLSERSYFWGTLIGAMVLDADRISALSRGTNFFWDEFDQLFLRQVRSDRSILTRTYFQYDILKNDKLALLVGGMASGYRELLIGDTRSQFAYGFDGGLSGRLFKKKMYWRVSYGAAQGINQNKWVHEFALRTSWRFKP